MEYDPVGAFLPDTVENLMRVAEPVPTIAGITKQEGYMHFRSKYVDEIQTRHRIIHSVRRNSLSF